MLGSVGGFCLATVSQAALKFDYLPLCTRQLFVLFYLFTLDFVERKGLADQLENTNFKRLFFHVPPEQTSTLIKLSQRGGGGETKEKKKKKACC